MQTSGRSDTYFEKAVHLYERILNLFSVADTLLFTEYYPSRSESDKVSFLWPYSGMFSAANAIAKIPANKADMLLKLGNVIKGLESYHDNERKPEAYQALPGFAGGSDRFYDDNEWLGIDFLEAYELTHDQEYLHKAETIFKFIISGWSHELGGGIYWCEQKKDTKNTCSNAPASIMALKLYTITGKVDYLDWGTKLYEWTLQKLQSPDGVFWDNINLEGKVDERKYTYNSGTMMHAAALLYKITSNDKYLKQSQRIAEASFQFFTSIYPESGGSRLFVNTEPWFTAVLFRGYIALYRLDHNRQYVDSVIDSIDYAWNNALDENGLIERDWRGINRQINKWLLDEACMVEMYANAAAVEAEQNT